MPRRALALRLTPGGWQYLTDMEEPFAAELRQRLGPESRLVEPLLGIYRVVRDARYFDPAFDQIRALAGIKELPFGARPGPR